MIVLSKFLTLTAFSVTSITVPFAPYFSIVIQSPGRSISLAESCMPATNPKSVSLNTSIRIAAEAPSPANSVVGDLPIRMLMISIKPIKKTATCNSWMKPFSGLFLSDSFRLYISCTTFREALMKRSETAMM